MVISVINYFLNLNPLFQALIAGIFTFFITALGSGIVLLFKKINKSILNIMLAISAGIMISASFFSLLNPAIEICPSGYLISFSFLSGGILILLCDKLLSKFCRSSNYENMKMSLMLFISITLHNIPEGLVLGVAFASTSSNSIAAAISLTLGIAIQNFPEGAAISLPLRREKISRFKAFIFGSLSAIVEPIFAVLGALIVLKIQSILPIIMSLTAGAMIFVTILELIPESLTDKRKDLMALFVMIGFIIMMFLELVL